MDSSSSSDHAPEPVAHCSGLPRSENDTIPVIEWALGNASDVSTDYLERYEILKPLGSGGAGSVYLARDRKSLCLVALKRAHSSAACLQQEAETAAQLRHPNIVEVHGVERYAEFSYLAMEYLQGGSLALRLEQESFLSVGDTVNCMLQAAAGLHYMHQQGLVHRDVKPANLLITRDGKVKVADFGLTRTVEPDGKRKPLVSPKTLAGADTVHPGQTDSPVGTKCFMAPELFSEPYAADATADVYALGCTCYALLLGCPPTFGQNTQEIVAHRMRDFIPIDRIRLDVPSQLARVATAMVAKERRYRIPSMDAVIAELRELAI